MRYWKKNIFQINEAADVGTLDISTWIEPFEKLTQQLQENKSNRNINNDRIIKNGNNNYSSQRR